MSYSAETQHFAVHALRTYTGAQATALTLQPLMKSPNGDAIIEILTDVGYLLEEVASNLRFSEREAVALAMALQGVSASSPSDIAAWLLDAQSLCAAVDWLDVSEARSLASKVNEMPQFDTLVLCRLLRLALSISSASGVSLTSVLEKVGVTKSH